MAQPTQANILDYFADLDDPRVERRECWVITDQDCLDYLDPQGQWPSACGGKAAIKVVGHRQTTEGRASQPRYCISPPEAERSQRNNCWPPSETIGASRTPRTGPLDVTFREDQCRVRKDHGPQNINILRQTGHNLLKNERTLKVGIPGKRLNAGWDEDYLLKVLLQ